MGGGSITATSSNTNIATVSVNGRTITVTYKAPGSCTITVSVSQTVYYNSTSAACSITCSRSSLTIPTIQSATVYCTGSYTGPVVYNYNSSLENQSGTTGTTILGTYTITWTLKDTNKYCWSDSSTGSKSVTWNCVGGTVTYYIQCSGTGYDCGVYWVNAQLGSSGRSTSTIGKASITKTYSSWNNQSFNDEIGYKKSGSYWYPTSLDLYNLRGWRRNRASGTTQQSITYLTFNTQNHWGPNNGVTYYITA